NKRMVNNGVPSGFSINWKDLMSFKRTFTDHIPEKKEQALNKQGIDTYHGKASFISEDQLEVDQERLEGKHFLIASGAKPTPLPIQGEEH
ncbi:NAD(P)/FAD-dependent oxidoreductase, partial [Planococcus sp. SIMBA_143]